jgi:hypothetical protein
MNRKMSRLPLLLAIAVLMVVLGNFMGCETEDWLGEINCNDCYGSKPDSANLVVYITLNAENDSVPLTFYRGSYEEGEIDWQDTATTKEFYLYSKVGSMYTVRATYNSGDKIIEAFDDDKMTIYDGEGQCGSPCKIVKGGIFDLRLLE